MPTGDSRNTPGKFFDWGAGFYHVEHPQAGAIGNGSTDDSAQIGAAITAASSAGGGTVLLGPKTYKATGLSVPAGVALRGVGWRSALLTTANAPLISVTGEDVDLERFRIIGNATSVTNTSQIGISINAHWRLRMFKVLMESLFNGVYAITTEGNLTNPNWSQGGELIGCETLLCQIGLNFDTRAEYLKVFGGRHHTNTLAVKVRGGNATFIGGDYNRNVDAFVLINGTNDSHGKAVGCNINHNTGYGIKATGIQNGFIFADCNIYESKILWDSSPGLVIKGGVLAPATFTVQNGCIGGRVEDTTIDEGYGLTYAIDVGSFVQWRNNRKLVDGTSGSYAFQANIRGGYFNGTPIAATIASGAAATVIDMNGLLQATCRNISQTLYTLWDTTNKRIIHKNLSDGRIRVDAEIKVTLAGGFTDNTNCRVEIRNQSGTVLSTIPAQLITTSTLWFRFHGFIEQNPGDSFGFYLINVAGSNATIVAAGSYVTAEGL